MKIKRFVDTLGRITIPVDIRRQLNLGYKDPICIELVGKEIIITKEKETE